MHPRRRFTVAAVAAALALSGCTEPRAEAEPTAPSGTVNGTVEASPTPSPSPTVDAIAPPEPPADLSRTDEVGAAAAAKYFLQLYAYTLRTGDVAAWDAMSWVDCEFCQSTRQFALQIANQGETFTGGEITAVSTNVLPRDELIGGYPVDVQITEAPSVHEAADGKVITRSSGRPGTLRVDTLSGQAGWKILAVVAQGA